MFAHAVSIDRVVEDVLECQSLHSRFEAVHVQDHFPWAVLLGEAGATNNLAVVLLQSVPWLSSAAHVGLVVVVAQEVDHGGLGVVLGLKPARSFAAISSIVEFSTAINRFFLRSHTDLK